MIRVLNKETIDRIAAGEVIERPASIVKELVENSVDAGALSVTTEIKDGGVSLIRVTDNGSGIGCGDVRTAFLRHATGKLKDAEDLLSIHTLGFRGEALSSIAAVTRTEVITKTRADITAIRYCIEGGQEKCYEEIGAPDGTTVITRDLFYNTPPRKKFLKTNATEGAHIAELMERLALSRPDIAFRLIDNGKVRLQTPGTGRLLETIYSVYGRGIAKLCVPVEAKGEGISISGYAAAPEASRPNRNFETFFINGRLFKSGIVSKAVEDGYEGRLMQHQFPFIVLNIETDPADTDVNVHPTKMEVRFTKPYQIYDIIHQAVRRALMGEVFIPRAGVGEEAHRDESPVITGQSEDTGEGIQENKTLVRPAEPFEYRRAAMQISSVREEKGRDVYSSQILSDTVDPGWKTASKEPLRIVGQVFSTYLIVEYRDRMYMVDQHAAHEKVYYERMLKQYESASVASQMTDPPVIITLSDTEAQALYEHMDEFTRAGYEIEGFGGREYAVRAVPDVISGIPGEELLKQMISDFSSDTSARTPAGILEKTASMACKAAVKAGRRLSLAEAEILMKELLRLDNPWCCPHGRPTMIEMTRSDIEKKFKRTV